MVRTPQPATPMSYRGRTVVVVGGTRGLGLQYVRDLASLGANVVMTGRGDNVEEIAASVGGAGGQVVGVRCDVRKPQTFMETALARFGEVDSLIVNAGVVRDRSFARMRDDEWQDVIDTHLGGAFACAKAVWPMMLNRQRGAILFTSSGAGFHGSFGQANYSAAKAGIIGFAKTLAMEGERANIRVNVIAPMASTDMTAPVFDDRLRNSLSVADVSPFALLLAHPDCPFSGEVIECGGKWAAAMRWQRSAGLRLDGEAVTMDHVQAHLERICDFGAGYDVPRSTADSLGAALGDSRDMIGW